MLLRRAINKCKRLLGKQIHKIEVPICTNELLKGKSALIIGGTGGIGEGIAKALVQAGCKVIITGRNQEKTKTIAERIGCEYIVMDLLDVSRFSEKILEAEEKINSTISILVNAAGIMGCENFGQVTEKGYDFIMDTNLKGVFFMSQAMGNYMISRKIKGHILNVSSSSALRNGCTPYEISKAGVASLTRGAAEMLIPYGIVVNAIGPGPVATSMLGASEDNLAFKYNPTGRLATTSEIAQLALFMVSDLGNYIVGDTFYISGGSGVIKL